MPKGQQRQNGLAEWEAAMMLSDDEVDDRLWDGAYKDGWRIVPRADAEGCARGTIRYTYVAPSGERLRSKTAAYAENEGTRLLHPATSDAQISPISAAAKQEADEAGLVLERSKRSATGYKNVVRIRGMRKPFKAEMMVSKKVMSLGFFSTAEEAALCCARQRAAVPAGARCLHLSFATVRTQWRSDCVDADPVATKVGAHPAVAAASDPPPPPPPPDARAA
jgi:hypothetical protein|eukprot:jgi/Chrpa1/8762/Chrysochromulina_OHIO_Genome00020083-RA